MRIILTAAAILVALAACSTKETPPPPPPTPPTARTAEQQRARDSTIGASALPGARGVRGALAVSDSAARRRAELDSIAKTP